MRFDLLLGEDVFTASQKREIRKSLSSYRLEDNFINPEDVINIVFKIKKDSKQMTLILFKKGIDQKTITNTYKVILMLVIGLNLKIEKNESKIKHIIEILNLKLNSRSPYGVVNNAGHWFGLSREEVEDTKVNDLLKAYKIAVSSNKNNILDSLLRKANNLLFK